MNTLLNKFLSLFLRKLPGIEDHETYEYRGWTVIVRHFSGFDPLNQRHSIGVKQQIGDELKWRGAWTGIYVEAWPFLTELDKRKIIHLLMDDARELTEGVSPYEVESYLFRCNYNKNGTKIGYDIVRQEPAQ